MIFDLIAHLDRQRAFSEKTFGPGSRTQGVIDHIRKELKEIDEKPFDLYEWIDVILLGLDGAWRAGYTSKEIVIALETKQTMNEARSWPRWQDQDRDKAIQHERPEASER